MIQAGHAVPMNYSQVSPYHRMVGRMNSGAGPYRPRGFSDLLGNRYSSPTPTFDALMGRGPRSGGIRASVADKMISQPAYMGRTPYRTAARIGGRMRQGLRGFGGAALGLDIAFTGADMLGQGMTNATRWASKTGREEDYIGGFAFGATKAAGANIGATGGAMAGAAIGSAILPGFGTVIGGIIGGIAGYTIGDTAMTDFAYQQGRFYSSMAATSVSRSKIEFGTGFNDSQAAYTMRQMAVQEMSGSLLNARQYLGNEAYFMHR